MNRDSVASAPQPESAREGSAPTSGVALDAVVGAEVLERITDGFFALDRQGRFVYINRSAEDLLAQSREDLLGRSVWEVFPEAAESSVYRKYQKAFSEQETIQFEQIIPRLGRCYRVRLFPSEAGLSVYFRDVTGEKRTEEVLRASETQFREIAEHIREVLYLATPDAGEVIYVSPTFDEIWGLPRERLLEDAEAWSRAIDSRDRDRVLAAMPGMKDGKFEERYRIVRPDGAVRWILDRAFPVRNDAGEVYRIVGIAEDVTADTEAEAERERLLAREREIRRAAEREAELREEVLAVVSHDLKNPLNSIRLSAGMLRDIPVPEEKRGEILDRILSATEQMERLIRGLLDTSRLEAGQGLSVEPRSVERADLLREACALFRPQIEAKQISLDCESPGDCPPVYADFDRLLQVFWNLIGNAAKFTPEGGRIVVRAEQDGEVCRFSITDSGSGIPPENLGRLFDPYWQEKRTARLGTGLGLPISKAIVEAHQGEIWVESRLGHGTTFFFTVPCARTDRDDSAESGAPRSEGETQR